MLADSKRRSLYELCRELANGKENCKAVLEWVEGATGARLKAANALKVLKGIGQWTYTQESIIESKIIEMERWACQSNRIR
jgi:3-methyladenine DNA glycosylase/8-oxoguanine DNA glycosylase